MKIQCDICGGITNIQRKEKVYLDPTGDFVCSFPCVQAWIAENARLNVALREGFIYASDLPFVGSRADFCYSTMLNMYFRSWYEMYVAEALSEEGYIFAYEKIAIQVGMMTTYIPDFVVSIDAYRKAILEVKGVWGASQKSKLKKLRKQYPELPILVLTWPIANQFYPKGRKNVRRYC